MIDRYGGGGNDFVGYVGEASVRGVAPSAERSPKRSSASTAPAA